jgi:hypothetical protein
VAFLDDVKHIVSGDRGKIQRWRTEDGREVGPGGAKDAGSPAFNINIPVSRDGKWVVSGMNNGRVKVWNAENHANVQKDTAGK